MDEEVEEVEELPEKNDNSSGDVVSSEKGVA